MSRMRNLIMCNFIFKNQSHYSGICGQRVNQLQAFLEIIKVFDETMVSAQLSSMVALDGSRIGLII